MKEININSNEEALTQIVELVSGIPRSIIRSKDRHRKIAIARSILGVMLWYEKRIFFKLTYQN